MAQVDPTQDWTLSFTPNGDGTVTVDLALSPSGDVQFVSGIDRLRQDVLLWLLTPQGCRPLDPTYGNPLYGLLMRPGSVDVSGYTAIVQQMQDAFVQQQQYAVAQGYLSADEQVDSFTDPVIDASSPGTVVVNFTIVAASGGSASVTLPTFSLG